MGDDITFSFGDNWTRFLERATQANLDRAESDIVEWLGRDEVAGASVVDVGSGSGLHSLAFHRLGADRIVSFDIDPASVKSTRDLWERAGRPNGWTVTPGSILDAGHTTALGRFDVVYAWGVLHHTGAMWDALEAACDLVEPGGLLWLSLYSAGPDYERHLALKVRYNRASGLRKRAMVYRRVGRLIMGRVRRLENPFGWNKTKHRGMSPLHDIIDWLGGLPYEVADPEEVARTLEGLGFAMERVKERQEGACSVYLARRAPRSSSRGPLEDTSLIPDPGDQSRNR